MKLYKVLLKGADGKVFSTYTDYTPYLPSGSSPGLWLPPVVNPRLFTRGYHVTSNAHRHMTGSGVPYVVFEAEGAGVFESHPCRSFCTLDDQWAFETIRLIRQVPWLAFEDWLAQEAA